MPNFNDIEPTTTQRESTIPAGIYAVELSMDRNKTLEHPPENANEIFNGEFYSNFYRKSSTSPLYFFALCFTVISPDYAKRKFWKNMSVYGAVDEGQKKAVEFSGMIGRRLIESHYGLEHEDVSEKAINLRNYQWQELDGLNAVLNVEIKKSTNPDYPDDENVFTPWNGVLTASDPQYAEYAQYFTNKTVNTSAKTFESKETPQVKANVASATVGTTAHSKADKWGI